VLAKRFDAFLFDLDGTVYLGDELLPGSKKALTRLRRAGKEVRFLTNDPRPTREQLHRQLIGLGVEVRREELVTSGWSTASYLAQEGVRSAYVIGSRGLASEIGAAGVEVIDRGPCEAVVVGSDEHVSYTHLRHASRYLFEGARFVATNADASVPSPKGPLPGTGAIVAALRVTTGREPVVVGKPFAAMFDTALKDLAARRDRTVMIGDSLESDITGAHRAGIAGVLIAREVGQPSSQLPPALEAIVSDLGGLFDPAVEVGGGSCFVAEPSGAGDTNGGKI
jgi:phosphoglycolate/pyridoxal phosphate phosphatase family enzyme